MGGAVNAPLTGPAPNLMERVTAAVTAPTPGLAAPWKWIQPRGTDEILKRLADARDLAVPERERENMCSVAHGEITRLRDQVKALTAVLQTVADEVCDGHRPYSNDSYLPAHIKDKVRETVAELRGFPDFREYPKSARPDLDLDSAGRPLRAGT